MAETNISSRIQRIVEKKVNLAKENDTWVVRARTPDSRIVLRIARDADRGIRILRGGIVLRFSEQEVLPLLKEYYEVVKKLNEAAEKICQKAGVPYTPPRELRPEKYGDPQAEVDAKVEKVMDVT